MATIESKIKDEFFKIITENKKELFTKIAAERTNHITVVLENIYQEHNASAVVRSCDCFGIQELHVIEKGNAYKVQRDIALELACGADISCAMTCETNPRDQVRSRGKTRIRSKSPDRKTRRKSSTRLPSKPKNPQMLYGS